MSSPLPVCPLGLLPLRALSGIQEETCWQDMKVAFQSLLLYFHTQRKKSVESLVLWLLPCTGSKTRTTIPVIITQVNTAKHECKELDPLLHFQSGVLLSSVDTLNTLGLSVCLATGLHDGLLFLASSSSHAVSELHKITYSHSLHPVRQLIKWPVFSEMLISVEIIVTLKNRDTEGKPIKHLLNQDQATRLCETFSLISMKTKCKAT